MPFYLKKSENINQTTRHLKFRYISIFYKSSTDWQLNENCKNYMQLDQLPKVKGTKGRLKRNIKML